ncbi:MAG: amidohydrolase family protein [Rhodospirillaceae bacterium]|nr:amidohydrolase family protein [Rhodospirillaceae bacterium]
MKEAQEAMHATVWADRLLARPGYEPAQRGAAIAIADGRIAGLHTDKAAPADGSGGAGTLALPALCNAHDHGRGLRPSAYGVADDAVEFWVPGTYTMPPLDPHLVAAVALGRMAASGTASIVHCHLFRPPERLIVEAEAVARAAREIGVRVAFVVPLRDRNRLGYGDDDAILAHMDHHCRAAVAEQFQRPLPAIEAQLDAVEEIAARCGGPLFHVQFGPIGVEWCSDALLARVAEASARTGLRVHMHLLESPIQRQWTDAAYPGGVVGHLDAIGLLSPRLAVAHGVWLRPEECALLAERGVTLSVNSTSNLRLRSGIAPMAAIRAARLGFALGMDSLSLDDDEDMLRELRLAFRLHRGFGHDDTLDAAGLFDAAVQRGARIVTGADDFGTLAPGRPADVLVLDYAAMSADMIEAVCDETDVLLARATADHVRTLLVAGRPVVAGGKLTGLDLAAAESELSAAARRFAPQLSSLRPTLAAYRAGLRRFYAAGGHRRESEGP